MYATLGPAESFEMMNRAGPTRPYRSLTAYFSENIKDRITKFWYNLDPSLKNMLFKFGVYIFPSLETMRFLTP